MRIVGVPSSTDNHPPVGPARLDAGAGRIDLTMALVGIQSDV